MTARKDTRPRFISIDETCEYTGLSRRKIYDLMKGRKIVAKKLGTRTLIERASVDKFLNALPRLAAS